MMSRLNLPKWVCYALIILLVSILQSQTDYLPKILGASPLIIIPAVVCIAGYEGETVGGAYGIFAGLVWDCTTGRIFGFNAFFLMILGIIVGLFVKYLFRNTLFAAVIFTAVLTVTHEIVTWFFFYYMTRQQNFLYSFTSIIIPTAAYTLIFVFIFYFVMGLINRKFPANE